MVFTLKEIKIIKNLSAKYLIYKINKAWRGRLLGCNFKIKYNGFIRKCFFNSIIQIKKRAKSCKGILGTPLTNWT